MTLTTKMIVFFLLLSTIPLTIVGYLAYDNGRLYGTSTVRKMIAAAARRHPGVRVPGCWPWMAKRSASMFAASGGTTICTLEMVTAD